MRIYNLICLRCYFAMNNDTLRNELADYVGRISNTSVQIDSPLIEHGIIDSFSVLQIVDFIEERLGLEIDPEELPIEEFYSVETLVSWVQRLNEDKIND